MPLAPGFLTWCLKTPTKKAKVKVTELLVRGVRVGVVCCKTDTE